ncbi:MAG: hypothetical protein DRQ88_13175, partial [Epsilonproteobacteria bacterium]
MQHAYRLNGCVDFFKKGEVVFDKKKTVYHRNFLNKGKALEKAIELALHYGKEAPFKKTETGRKTYQEFKHISSDDFVSGFGFFEWCFFPIMERKLNSLFKSFSF